MFKCLLDFGYKRDKLQALGFCIAFLTVGLVFALSMGAVEYFLFSGHKFKHVISGGQFVALVEVWIVSYLVINAKRLHGNLLALTLMATATFLCLIGIIVAVIPVGILTTLSPAFQPDGKSINQLPAKLFKIVVVLIPASLLIFDFMFIGIIPAIGIESAKTISYMAKHPEAVQRRDEIASALNAYRKVQFNRTAETALKGYHFATVLAKHKRFFDSKNVLDGLDPSFLDSQKQGKVEKLKFKLQQYSNRQKMPLDYFSEQIDRGYCTENERAGSDRKRGGDYANAAESYKNVFETMGCDRAMVGFDLITTFEQLKQYKDATYLIDQMIAEMVKNENSIKDLETKKQVFVTLSSGSRADEHYKERYEKFKDYRDQFLKAKKIDAKTDPNKAEETLLLALQMAPTIVDVVRTRLLLANIYDKSDRYDKALAEIQWLRQNMGKVNDRIVDSLDWNEWVITQRKLGGDVQSDPLAEEIQRIIEN